MADLGNIGRLVGGFTQLYGGTISGEVRDAAGIPASRIVRAYSRVTGAPSGAAISNATTGAYAINTSVAHIGHPHTVIEFDDAAGDSYNARVFDNVIPL